MRKYILLPILFLCANVFAQGPYSIDVPNVPVVVDFEGFLGNGFLSPIESNGQLDSYNWAITGLTDGDLDFAGAGIGGDFEGYTVDGGVTGGGFYAFVNENSGNTRLWVQPTGNDFTPGTLTYRIQNNSGLTLNAVELTYALSILNDGERSNSMALSYSLNGADYTDLPEAFIVSAEMSDGSAIHLDFTASFQAISIAPEDFFYVRWATDDVAGSGSRDEFGWDDISITGLVYDQSVVNFGSNLISFEEDLGNANYEIEVFISSGADCSLTYGIDEQNSTATFNSDYELNTTEIVFTADGPTTMMLPITIIDDMEEEGDESFVIQFFQAEGDCEIGTNNMIEVVIEENDQPALPITTIADATAVDEDGNAFLEGQEVAIIGVIHTPNFRPSGLDFVVIDATGGIHGFGLLNEFGYDVTMGDEVSLEGTIGLLNGLVILNLTSLELLGQGLPLVDPMVVTELNESTESEFITIENLTLEDPAEWDPFGSGFNVNATNGITTFEIRIDADIDLFNLPAPTYPFTITGVGGQYDFESPYTEGYQIFPRFESDIVPAFDEPTVIYNTNYTISEENPEETNISVTLTESSDCDVTFALDVMSSTATEGEDLQFVTNSVSFSAGGSTAGSFTIQALDDDVLEGMETGYIVATANGDCAIGVNSSIVVGVEDNEIPEVDVIDIVTVAEVNGAGIATMLDQEVSVQGIVYGINLRPAGLQFTIIDETGGIGVFNDEGTMDYNVNEGEELIVKGVVDQYSGLTQINPLSIEILSGNNALKSPTVVTTLNEDTESDLIQILGVSILDASEWDGEGSGFTVTVSDGNNDFDLRIDNDVNLFTMPAPGGVLNITGIGGQFDFDEPFLDGYQIMPRYASDIEVVTGIHHFEQMNEIIIAPNPVQNQITIDIDYADVTSAQIYDVMGKIVSETEIFNGITIDVSRLSPGYYTVIFNGNETQHFGRFVKAVK